MKGLFVIICCLFFLSDIAQFQSCPNRHYLLRDGHAFFWLGDTGWELFHRLNREQADQYLKTRSSQGFTVIQAIVLAEFDGLHTPNAYGDFPLLQYDLVIGLLPTWGDKVTKSWGIGPIIFNPENAGIYGRWRGDRTGF